MNFQSTRPARTSAFVILCASAGALAVPLHAIFTPLAAVVGAVLALVGLRVWRWSNLPHSFSTRGPAGNRRLVEPVLWLCIGLVVGLLLLGVIRLIIEPAVPGAGVRIAAAGELPVWRRAVIIYVAAISEELLFRLLLLSLLAGLIARLTGRANAVPDRTAMWVANGASALAFAGSHLPSWSRMGSLSPGLMLMVVALNGLGGLVFGYLFVKRGIGAAMWAHAGGDCAIQLIGPLTG